MRRPLPLPSSRGFLTSAPNEGFREVSELRAGFGSRKPRPGRRHDRFHPDRGGVASGSLPRLYCALFRSRVWKIGMLKGPAPARDLDPWPREARPEPYPARPRARRGHSPHGGRGEQHPAPRALTRLGAKPSPSSWHPGRPGPARPSWMSPEPGPSSLGICHDVTMGKKEACIVPFPALCPHTAPSAGH